MAHGFGGFANAFGIVEETAFLRVILVHPLQDFAQGHLSLARLAHRKVEHHAQQLAFVVVRNAALGAAVVAVASSHASRLDSSADCVRCAERRSSSVICSPSRSRYCLSLRSPARD